MDVTFSGRKGVMRATFSNRNGVLGATFFRRKGGMDDTFFEPQPIGAGAPATDTRPHLQGAGRFEVAQDSLRLSRLDAGALSEPFDLGRRPTFVVGGIRQREHQEQPRPVQGAVLPGVEEGFQAHSAVSAAAATADSNASASSSRCSQLWRLSLSRSSAVSR